MPRTEPTPYTPTDAELQALGARLFGLEEHNPTPRTSGQYELSDDRTNKERKDVKN